MKTDPVTHVSPVSSPARPVQLDFSTCLPDVQVAEGPSDLPLLECDSVDPVEEWINQIVPPTADDCLTDLKFLKEGILPAKGVNGKMSGDREVFARFPQMEPTPDSGKPDTIEGNDFEGQMILHSKVMHPLLKQFKVIFGPLDPNESKWKDVKPGDFELWPDQQNVVIKSRGYDLKPDDEK